MLVDNSKSQQLKEWLRLVAKLVDQQLKACFRRFKLKAFVFQTLELIEDSLFSCKLEI